MVVHVVAETWRARTAGYEVIYEREPLTGSRGI